MKEKWYGTEYNIAPFDRATQIDRWTRCVQGDSEFKDSVSLPLKNPFVPTDFTIRSATSSTSFPAAATGAVVGGAESAGEALETRAKPSLLEHVTTVTPVSEDADDTEIDTVVDATAALSVTEGAPVSEATEGQEEGAEEEEEEVEEEEEKEEPVGPVPALQGKVNTSDNSTNYYLP